MKRYLVSIIIIAASLISLGISVKSCVNKNHEIERLEHNQEALQDGVTYYRTADSIHVASVQVLTLERDELKKHYDDLVKEAANLKLQVKRLESASRTVLSTNYGLEMQWQDNVVYLDGTVDTIRCLDYQDNYLTFKGCDEGDLLKADIFIVDTLVQFVHRVPKQWWFFKWGTKAIRQEVLSKNPHTTITYTEYIEL